MKRFAKGPSTILIMGESGTGKELFAQAIHNASDRKSGPLVSVNCGAIPGELIQSELFGYVEGAFTGAKKAGRPGKLEQADGGTIFLERNFRDARSYAGEPAEGPRGNDHCEDRRQQGDPRGCTGRGGDEQEPVRLK